MPRGMDAWIAASCALIRPQLRQQLLHLIHHADDVGPRLAEDDEVHGPLVVQISAGADVLHGIGHRRDIR